MQGLPVAIDPLKMTTNEISWQYLQFVKYLADILKQLFPEKLRKAALVDPPSVFIHSYEIIKKFIDVRNDYITKHNTKDILNDWKGLVKYWNDENLDGNFESSSVILLFLNPPNNIKSNINFKRASSLFFKNF